MSAGQLYDTWFARIRELLPTERITRVRNLVWLIVGLHLRRAVHLRHIAVKLPFPGALRSVEQRLDRFLQNAAFQVRTWYRPLATTLLEQAARCACWWMVPKSAPPTSCSSWPWPIANGPCPWPGVGPQEHAVTVTAGNNWSCCVTSMTWYRLRRR